MPERKSGRCLDRQRRMMSDAAKTPNEVASAIKDKKARVAIKTLLRKQNDNVRQIEHYHPFRKTKIRIERI